jgi:hypothetical protein
MGIHLAAHFDEILNRRSTSREGLRTVSCTAVKQGEIADRFDFLGQHFSYIFSSTGSLKQKTVPRGSFGAAQSWPPCASTSERQIERPIPKPVGLVV